VRPYYTMLSRVYLALAMGFLVIFRTFVSCITLAYRQISEVWIR